MNPMRIGRIILGGLLAGLIINIAEIVTNGVILRNEWTEWSRSIAHVPPPALSMTLWTVIAFALGISGIWIYASIRPRYGAGPKTALVAGFVLWIIYWPLVVLQHMALGTVPAGLLWKGCWGGLVGVLLAILAGAAIYKE